MNKYSYDINQFNFIEITEQIFNIDNLNQIHTILEKDLDLPDDPSKDQQTIFHKIFYKIYDQENSPFLLTYKNFIKHISDTYFSNQNIIYQTRPTFRVQIPNNIAVAKWHKDKAYNHSNKEINIFLPLTDAFDTNTIWAESEEDKGDYSPMNTKAGEFYIWNGANLNHGNKKNETGFSRVSVDFRIILEENFDYSGTSVTTKVPMKLGHYWSQL